MVALAPEPTSLVYDNIWWSALFAMTSGGLPALISGSPPHDVEAHFERKGRTMCETWHFNPYMRKAMSKGEIMGSSARGRNHVRLEWASFFLGFVLWLSFCVYFGHTLKPALDFTLKHTTWRERCGTISLPPRRSVASHSN